MFPGRLAAGVLFCSGCVPGVFRVCSGCVPGVFRIFFWQKVGFFWQKVGICFRILALSKKVRIFASSFERERATQGCDP